MNPVDIADGLCYNHVVYIFERNDIMIIKWQNCFKIGVSIFLLYLGITYWPALTAGLGIVIGAALPLAIGGIIAYLVNIMMAFFERLYFPKSHHKAVIGSRRAVCMLLAFIALFGIITLIVWLVLPEFISCIQLIIQMIPPAINRCLAWVESLEILPEDIINVLESFDWKSKIEQIISVLYTGVGGVVDVAFKTVSTVFSAIVTGILSLIFAIYLLLGKNGLMYQSKRLMKHYLKESIYEKVMYFVGVLNDSFHKFIVGQCLEAVILGALCTAGMMIFKFPYATMIGALVAFTALIPVAGAYIGAGVGAFMILTVSPIKALFFLVFILILQQLEGNLIYPKVVGSSIGLPGIWVLAAVTVGGGIGGVGGMLLGVPLTASVYKVVRDDMNNHPKEGDLPEEEPAEINAEPLEEYSSDENETDSLN